MDLEKMRAALAHMNRADDELSLSGAYGHPAGLHSVYALRDAIEDLEADIARVETGTLEEEYGPDDR